MEKKLSAKFIIVSIAVLLAVLTVIGIIINVANYNVIVGRTDNVMEVLIENDGTFSNYTPDVGDGDNIYEETPYMTRYFTAVINQQGYVTSTDTDYINSVDSTMAEEYALSIIEKGKEIGFFGVYRYAVVTYDDGSSLVICIDSTHNLQLFYSFLQDTILICGIALLVFSVLVIVLARKFVNPVAQSYEKQKQFITDVTHEFKTPLAIIKANNEVIEIESGNSQWLESTNSQVERLDEMIKRLTFLARIDEHAPSMMVEKIDLSKAVAEATKGFETLAMANNRTLKVYIEDDIKYNISTIAVNTLVNMLLDNAIKYSFEESKITFCLKNERNRIVMSCENACHLERSGKYDKWFERFYREDVSRNNEKVAGYGIGLSTAHSIVKSLDGKMTAFSKNGKTITIKIELKPIF